MALPFIQAKAQFLHIGLKTYITPQQELNSVKYNINDYVYYFANQKNETIRFSGFESENSNYIPQPCIFVKYEKGNHLFFQFDTYAKWMNSEAGYENSVDFSEYTDTFNPESVQKNLGYNSIKLKWFFMGNSLTAGFTFLKTRSVRPYIYGGLSALYLLNFAPGDYYDDTRGIRNAIIFKNLKTFRAVTLHGRVGLGVKYHGLSLDVYFENNLSPLDIYEDEEEEEWAVNTYEKRPNYDYFRTVNVSLSINLLSFNFSKKQTLN